MNVRVPVLHPARRLLTARLHSSAAPAHDHSHGEDTAQPRVRRACTVAGRRQPLSDCRQVTDACHAVMWQLLPDLQLGVVIDKLDGCFCSNVGANFSLIGSLAAVMWIKLLKVCLLGRYP